MEKIDFIKEFNIDKNILDDEKEQTKYKIKYVSDYVSIWTKIEANRDIISNIDFIDCMCNAGIYKNGDFGTAVKVLKIFRDAAYQYPNKTYNLFLNDYNAKRVEIIRKICEKIIGKTPNIKLHTFNKDVNDFLDMMKNEYRHITNNPATILYVDPYDLGTVHIDKISNFLMTYYSEVIFNVFTSDFVRNGIHPKMRSCIGDANFENKDELMDYVSEKLRVGKIKFSFAYEFRIKTNNELYRIFYATPNPKGLEVLKDSIWKVFNGHCYHKNTNIEEGQMSFFDEINEEQIMIDYYSKDAQNLLIKKYKNKTVEFVKIEQFILERTMMRKGQIIKNVIMPLITNANIVKLGETERKNCYTKDRYKFIG